MIIYIAAIKFFVFFWNYVAVAFTNDECRHSTYFFGKIVESQDENSLVVNFLTKEKDGGAYCWTTKEACEIVYRRQIFSQGLHPFKTKNGSLVFIEDELFLNDIRCCVEELLALELTSEVREKYLKM